MIDRSKLREALKFVSISDSEQDAVAAAARAWVDLYEDDGSLNRERLEAAAKAIDIVIGIPDDGDDYELPLVRRNEAEAAVLAFLEGK